MSPRKRGAAGDHDRVRKRIRFDDVDAGEVEFKSDPDGNMIDFGSRPAVAVGRAEVKDAWAAGDGADPDDYDMGNLDDYAYTSTHDTCTCSQQCLLKRQPTISSLFTDAFSLATRHDRAFTQCTSHPCTDTLDQTKRLTYTTSQDHGRH